MESMGSLMNQIWAGEYLATQNKKHDMLVYQKVVKNVVNKSSMNQLSSKLKCCRSNLERIELVAPFYVWISPIESDLKTYQKSDDLSAKFRQLGNEFYRNRKFTEALRAYNLGIIFASSSKELSLCFGNRSALALETSKPFAALEDIQMAESLDYPSELKPKLKQRQEKCSRLLKLSELESQSWKDIGNSQEDLMTDEMKRRREYCTSQLFKLKNQNNEINSAETFVRIAVNEERGRHVVVTEDIKPGSVVIVDEPFAKILLKELCWDLEHCHNCHKPTKFGIPCGGCAFAYYCSNQCLDTAASHHHQYECKTLPILYLLHLSRIAILSLRIMTLLAPEKLLRLFEKQQKSNYMNRLESQLVNSEIPGFENGIYDSSSYKTIFNLISHPDKLEPSEIISYCLTSLNLVNILQNHSSFFSGLFIEDSNKLSSFKYFVASLILLHMQNLPPNAHSLNELQNLAEGPLSPESIKNAYVNEYGAGAFALLSLINHSCSPNVFRINQWDGKTSVVTLSSLKAGDELLDNYGAHFAIDEITERRRHLLQNYYFHCTCFACSNNWPLYNELKLNQEVFTCQKCAELLGLVRKFESSQQFFEQCVITNFKTNCLKCLSNYDVPLLTKNLNLEIDRFFTAYDQVLNNRPLEAIKVLCEVLEYFEKSVFPPFSKMNDAQETFKQGLNLIVYFANIHC